MAAPNTDFSQGSIWKNIVRMSIPITLAQLINILYNIVDRMYIGHIPGAGALALTGLGLCLPVISIVMAFARLSGMGGGPLCSIERGKGDLQEAERIMGNSFTLLMIFAVVLTFLGEVFLRPILMAFGASNDTVGYAMDYGRVYLAGNVFVLISLGMNNFINAQGFARTGMVTTLVGAVLNIVLDPIFIFVLDWGSQRSRNGNGDLSGGIGAVGDAVFNRKAGPAAASLGKSQAECTAHRTNFDPGLFRLCDGLYQFRSAGGVQFGAQQLRRRFVCGRDDRAQLHP